MTALTDNMSFGIFLAPFHRVGENPTLALERDLELLEWLDALGYDEAWIGEHPQRRLGRPSPPLRSSLPPPPAVPAASAWGPAS